VNPLTVAPTSSPESAIVTRVTPAAQAESAAEKSLPGAVINGPFDIS
jgi:hypothetical protein